MRLPFIVLLVVLAFCSSASASKERIIEPHQVAISGDAGKPFGEVTIEIKTNKAPNKPKITSIRLKVNGEWKDVPKKAFADLDSPLLMKMEILTERGYDDSPWLYIYFELFHRDEKGTDAPKRVHICYHKHKFERRTIDTPSADGSYKVDNMSL
jgi:hypothetical protein